MFDKVVSYLSKEEIPVLDALYIRNLVGRIKVKWQCPCGRYEIITMQAAILGDKKHCRECRNGKQDKITQKLNKKSVRKRKYYTKIKNSVEPINIGGTK